MENWKDIKGYEGLYQININGLVKSLSREINNGNGIRKSKEFITKSYDNGHGYLRVCLSKNNSKKFILIHALIAIHFIENPENLPIINHKDGNKKNNSVSNLEWCTYSHNNQHGFNTGLIKSLKGEKCKKSKLSDIQVLEIKKMLSENKLTQKEISKKFNISSNTISSIKTKTTWKHL